MSETKEMYCYICGVELLEEDGQWKHPRTNCPMTRLKKHECWWWKLRDWIKRKNKQDIDALQKARKEVRRNERTIAG